jgi:hypothetical protein
MLDEAMTTLAWYSQYSNRRNNRTGHLFHNRYKSMLCEEDSYLLALIRYTHLNPVRARIVKTMRQLRRCKEEIGYSGAEIARDLGVNTTSINRAIARAEGAM